MSVEQIKVLTANLSKPLCVNMGFGIRQRPTTPLLSPRELEDLGVRVAIYPRMLTGCALQGMINGLELFRHSLDTGERVDRPEACVSFETLHDIIGMHEVNDLEKRFLTKAQYRAKYGNDAPQGTIR